MGPDPYPPVPLQPPPVKEGFWLRSATKAVIVSTAMSAFALAKSLRLAKPGDDPWLLVIDFAETAGGNWLSAWLGITAAGKTGR